MRDYYRHEYKNGDADVKYQRVFVSACCGGDLLMWDEATQEFASWDFVQDQRDFEKEAA
jgi:hypothetical protein